MSLPRRHRRIAGWLTLVALLLATLAPGLARALAFAQGELAPWGQICTVNGDSRGATGGAPADPAAHWLDHCPLCSLHNDGLGLPPTSTAGVDDVPALAHAAPSLGLHAPRVLPAWAPAQARAPPITC